MPKKSTTLVPVLMLVAALGAPSHAQAASIQVFNANATFNGGGTLSGTVTIDVSTGTVTSADLSGLIPRTFHFTTNVGGVPNYGNTGLYVIAADSNTPSFFPISLLALPIASSVGYAGGTISQGHVFFDDGTATQSLASGNLTYNHSNGATSYFDASGTYANGGTLSGNVLIDTVNGVVTAADLTAAMPIRYTFNQNVGGIPNYNNQGIFVIAADAPTPSFYPLVLLALPSPTAVGYSGGNLIGGSVVFSDGTAAMNLVSGSLTAVPEPSTAGAIGLLLIGGVAWKKRKLSSP